MRIPKKYQYPDGTSRKPLGNRIDTKLNGKNSISMNHPFKKLA
jgi:hypothetical protein